MYSLKIKDKSEVVIGDSAALLPTLLPKDKRVIVISDGNIDRLYNHTLLAHYEKILIGSGETIKTLSTMEHIYKQLIDMGADRSIFLLGIGGGIVSDITGFVAATYMRGVDFGFVSTTLLSQVDAGVGGKNGVNVGGYKNMVGTFNQPSFVICDINTLKSLSEREMRAGLAEVIKSAIINDKELFELLEQTTFNNLIKDNELLSKIVMASVKIKADIVEQDEREAGERRKLNLGHTFAHAIEKGSQSMIHGEAVAVGTIIVKDMALKLGLLSAEDGARIESLFLKMGFELQSPVPMNKMLLSITKDKKAEKGYIYMVFPTAIGDCLVRKCSFEELPGLI